jgi:CPA2 family monovalent cation:H+ antiporter-2
VPHLDLILTLTGGLTAALLLGYVTHRIGLSPIVGYLLAGVVVGPNTPGFVANKELADQFAEIGVILLMFGVGLHFHVKELLAVRSIALPGAIGQSLVATLLGCALGAAVGWGLEAGVVFGMAVSVASTVVMLRVLSDNDELHTPGGHIAIGWLLVEDLFTVLVLVLMPIVFGGVAGGSEAGGGNVLLAIGGSLLKIALLVVLVLFGAGRLVPWLLAHVARTRSRELFTLTVIVLALGIAVGAAQVFDASVALGAFLAGSVVGRSEFSARAASEALPMRDAFAVLFFVSVGMLFDPSHLIEAPGLVAATLAIVMIGKPAAALAITLLLGYPLRTSLAVAVVLAQIGEFSFIVGTLGQKLGVFPETAMNTLVAAAIVSISVNPLLFRLVDRVDVMVRRRPRLRRWLNARHEVAEQRRAEKPGAAGTRSRAIIVGCGPVGATLVRLLRENEIEPTVIELNLDTVRRLREQGIHALYGDASHRETLIAAGVERAVVLALTSSSLPGAGQVIELAREANPRILTYARTGYLRELPAMQQAGADAVFAGEGEVALSMTEFLLRQLGASAEQIDRERDRVRSELFGGAIRRQDDGTSLRGQNTSAQAIATDETLG